MIRPQVPPRAICRRANSAISRPAAIASTPNCCSQVPGLIACTVRPNASVWAGWKVSATHPDALFTRMSTGPKCSSAASNSAAAVAGSARLASMASARPPPARIWSATGAPSRVRPSR